MKATESRGQRDLQMSLRDAKDLHADITKLLLTLHEIQQKITVQSDTITVEIDGGGFKNS